MGRVARPKRPNAAAVPDGFALKRARSRLRGAGAFHLRSPVSGINRCDQRLKDRNLGSPGEKEPVSRRGEAIFRETSV